MRAGYRAIESTGGRAWVAQRPLRRTAAWIALLVCCHGGFSGCTSPLTGHTGWFGHHHAHHQPVPQLPNPLYIPVTNADFVWDQLVDATDDYFKIEREDRVRVVGDIVTEGTLTTFPAMGATCLEPWRGDSTHGFERLHSTLQTIRRYAIGRVMPAGEGYYVEVIVAKELEDLFQPQHATVGGTSLRHDGSIVRQQARPRGGAVSLGWIPLGRDVELEQRILVDLQARLAQVTPADWTAPPDP